MSTNAKESKSAPRKPSTCKTRIVVGVDEAGYGPNLGPLLIAGTAWRVSDAVSETDFAKIMSQGFCTRAWSDGCLHIPLGDSKQLYSSGSGLRTLESGLLAMLAQVPELSDLFQLSSSSPPSPGCFARLLERLVVDTSALQPCEQTNLLVETKKNEATQSGSPYEGSGWRDFAWYGCLPDQLPECSPPAEIVRLAQLAESYLSQIGIELLSVRALVVDESRFNTTVSKLGSKGRLLSSLTMQLVCELMKPWQDQPVEVFCDRQGGRKKYSSVLLEAMPEEWFDTLQELDARSSYRRQRQPELRVHFSVGGDSFPPTALASMTAKYLRERLMSSINRYWSMHVAELKPTAGYPNDARRYRDQIAAVAERLGHDPRDWWRSC